MDTPGPAQFAAVEARRWPRPAAAQAGAFDGRMQSVNSDTFNAGLGEASFSSFRNWRASDGAVHTHRPSRSSPWRGVDEPRSTQVKEDSESAASYKPATMQQQRGDHDDVVVDSILDSGAEIISETIGKVDSDAVIAGSDAEELQENAQSYTKKKIHHAGIENGENGYRENGSYGENKTINSLTEP